MGTTARHAYVGSPNSQDRSNIAAVRLRKEQKSVAQYLPQIDPQLMLAFLVCFLIMAVLHLYHRPELNGYNELERSNAFVMGLGTVMGVFIVLQIVRMVMTNSWETPGLQACLDLIVIAAGGGLGFWLMRNSKGAPPKENPYEKLHRALSENEEVMRGTIGNGD